MKYCHLKIFFTPAVRIATIFLFHLGFLGSCQQYQYVDAESVKSYINSCRKTSGGFGPLIQEYADLAWSYPAMHSLSLLGERISEPELFDEESSKSWIEKYNWRNGPWYWSLHQKANLYTLLGRSGEMEEDMYPGMSLEINFKPRTNYTEFRKYTEGEFFNLESLHYLTEAIYLLGGIVKNPEYVIDFVTGRQTELGGFDDLPDNNMVPDNSGLHLMNAYFSVEILHALKASIPKRQLLADWILACQAPEGGFRWHPDHSSYSNKADIMYTWGAVKALKILGLTPLDTDACIRWINSLQNSDGGFGDRPGWYSRLYSTYYALHALEILTGDPVNAITKKKFRNKNLVEIPDNEYSIFQAHHKSPSGGEEMVDTIVSMGLHFIAVKTTEKEVYESNGMSDVVKAARNYADQKNYKLEIVDSPENYRHRLLWFSGMKGNHVSNYMIPPNLKAGEWEALLSAYQAGTKEYKWDKFKTEVIRPVISRGTLFYPELDYTMINAYMVYDEGLDGNPGYNAVPAAHFGNYDWVRHFPYKERWLGQLPMIADGDAHGDIYAWRSNLESYRNVFIAKNNSLHDYVDASLSGRSVCVIRMPETGAVRYYGSVESINYLKKNIDEWKWWSE